MLLPIVDFRGADAAQAFCRSLRDTGFGVLSNHPLDQNLVQGIYAEWLQFFGSDARHQYTHDPVKLDGYFSPAVSETCPATLVCSLSTPATCCRRRPAITTRPPCTAC